MLTRLKLDRPEFAAGAASDNRAGSVSQVVVQSSVLHEDSSATDF
jgi:hypothetical protein